MDVEADGEADAAILRVAELNAAVACRPASVSFVAIGRVSPAPTVMMRSVRMLRVPRYDATELARRSESDWLYCSDPVLSV